jgi:hypothetical protein
MKAELENLKLALLNLRSTIRSLPVNDRAEEMIADLLMNCACELIVGLDQNPVSLVHFWETEPLDFESCIDELSDMATE